MRPGIFVGGVLAFSVLVTGIIVFGSVACSSEQVRQGLAGSTTSTPQALLAELKGDKARIDKISDDMMERIEKFNLARKPGQRTIRFTEIFYEDLTGQERDVLNSMLAQEKDLSYKSLLQKLIDDRNAVRVLQERVLHLEQNLPDKFVVARKGDSQYNLALTYLTEESHISKKKAQRLLSRIDVSDSLLPGNKVWFFYDDGRDTFRTYITRGDAAQTPIALRRAVKRKLITERDAATARANAMDATLVQTRFALQGQIDGLNGEIHQLAEKRLRMENQVAQLEESESDLKQRVSSLTTDVASSENSLYYHIETESTLNEDGRLTFFRKRLVDAKGVPYEQAIDLRVSSAIKVSAEEFGIDKIKRIRMLPGIYQLDRDYTVESSEDGTSATITILDRSLFRGKEVLLSVKG
jgi:hypothetical protein